MKKILKVLFDEFIYGSHLVALGAFGIVLSVILAFNLEIKPLVLLIGYLIYLIIYTYNHYRELRFDIKSNPERVKHLSGRQKWLKISPFIYITFLIVFLLLTNIFTASLTLFITLGGILYTEFFKKTPILGFKSYYVSFFWAILVLIIPLAYELDDVIPYLYIVLFIFIRGLVNTIFSDIKDIDSDRERKLKTFPVKWGKRKTLYILQIINLLSVLPLLIGVYLNDLPNTSLIFIITIVNGFYYLTKSMYVNDKNLRLISAILIDGEYILWPLVFIIGKQFI